MKKVLSKFVKNISIEEYYSIISPYNIVKDVRSLTGYFLEGSRKNLIVSNSNKANTSGRGKIIIKKHAYKRWQERVGNFALDICYLEDKINIYYQLGRLELKPNYVGIIDREILFTYEIKGNDVIITTFYGRLSQNPTLHQFEALRNYNLHYDEYVGFNLSSSKLELLPEPPIPSQRMIFRGETSTYLIEKYTDGSLNFFVLVVLEGPDQGVVREFYSDQPECERLEKSVRRALILLGDDDFVYHHIAYHHPEELRKRLDRIKGRK